MTFQSGNTLKSTASDFSWPKLFSQCAGIATCEEAETHLLRPF